MELKANELRIGNYLNHKDFDSYLTIDGFIGRDKNVVYTNLQQSYSELTDLKPIPLTEEWLKRLGFWTVSAGVDDGMRYIAGFELWKCNDLWLCNKNGVVIKFVHQLQNLYFSLTGQELTQQTNN